jgi:hypothetical protein
MYRWVGLSLLLVACSSPESMSSIGLGVVLRDLKGDWLLLKWQQYQVGGSGTADLIALGGTGQLRIASDGHFRFELDVPGYPARVDSGMVVVHGDNLFWVGELVETTYLVSLRSGILTLTATDPLTSTPPVPGGISGSVLEELQFRHLSTGP